MNIWSKFLSQIEKEYAVEAYKTRGQLVWAEIGSPPKGLYFGMGSAFFTVLYHYQGRGLIYEFAGSIILA